MCRFVPVVSLVVVVVVVAVVLRMSIRVLLFGLYYNNSSASRFDSKLVARMYRIVDCTHTHTHATLVVGRIGTALIQQLNGPFLR